MGKLSARPAFQIDRRERLCAFQKYGRWERKAFPIGVANRSHGGILRFATCLSTYSLSEELFRLLKGIHGDMTGKTEPENITLSRG